MADSFYWYDYETTGTDPFRDRVVQFAGQRTDLNFQPVGPPQVFYCQLPVDILPHPEACLVTGITPQRANAEGLNEADFTRRIEAEFSQPGTCVVGYNNIRFDDEFTRQLFYRNFVDPYAREWRSGNSRWDLIDVVRMTEALRPDGIVWPEREDGAPSFRLELLTKANGIAHEAAHDALSDVTATIGLAQKIRDCQPRLFDWALGLRNKHKVAELLDLTERELRIHVSGKYPAERHSSAVIMPMVKHPTNPNGVVVYDVSVDPGPFFDLSVEEIRDRLYTPQDQLPDGQIRVPLKTIHINKSPMVAPVNTLDDASIQRLQIDLDRCQKHREMILQADWFGTVRDVLDEAYSDASRDPELQLYSGGFFSAADRRCMDQILNTPSSQLAGLALNFEDERLPEMLFRYRARNFPESLDAKEVSTWKSQIRDRLTQAGPDQRLTLDAYFQVLDELVVQTHWSERQSEVIEQLLEYGDQIMDFLEQDD